MDSSHYPVSSENWRRWTEKCKFFETHGGDQRFQSYYDGFKEHDALLEMEKKFITTVTKKWNSKLQQDGTPWPEEVHQFIKSLEILTNARKILKFSCPFAYFLPEDSLGFLSKFQIQERKLELAVEKLAKLLKADVNLRLEISEDKVEKIKDLSDDVEKKVKVIEELFKVGVALVEAPRKEIPKNFWEEVWIVCLLFVAFLIALKVISKKFE